MELDKREAILQAEMALIAERGLHDTPMSLVARQSGASAGTIYHYFADKDDMIRSLYRYVKSRFNRALVEGIAPDMSHEQTFQQSWLNAYYFYYSHQTESRFLDQYENSPYYLPQMPDELAQAEEDLPALQALFNRITQDAAVKDLPLDAMYEMTIGVAARIAKHRRAGLGELGEKELKEIAAACYQAVTR